jgi:hypothetical protein
MKPKHLPPPRHLLSNHRPPLLTCGSCWTAGQRHMASTAADTAGSLTHTSHTQWFISQLDLTVSSQEYLKELRILLFQRALYKLPSRDVLKKGNYYFFFLITISASNLYMPMIWSYVFLLDFLIPFLCGPDLQCMGGGVRERRL